MRLWEKSLERFMNFRWSPRTTRTAGTAGTFGLRPRPPRGERAAYASRIGRYRSGRDSAAYSADLSLEAVVEVVERLSHVAPVPVKSIFDIHGIDETTMLREPVDDRGQKAEACGAIGEDVQPAGPVRRHEKGRPTARGHHPQHWHEGEPNSIPAVDPDDGFRCGPGQHGQHPPRIGWRPNAHECRGSAAGTRVLEDRHE